MALVELPKRESRPTRSWCAERFLSLFQTSEHQAQLELGMEYIERKRVLDFMITPGKVAAKIYNGAPTGAEHPLRVVMAYPQFNDNEWERVYDAIALQALFLARILAGDVPIEAEETLQQHDLSLFPLALSDIKFHCDCQSSSFCKHLAAFVYRVAESLENDPFVVLNLRGRGREEILAAIGRRRAELKHRYQLSLSDLEGLSSSDNRRDAVNRPNSASTSLSVTVDAEQFWNARPELFEISYHIKADELPAAILRHLDPIPLTVYDSYLDTLLEELYARVARRAQAYGLSLRNR